MFENRNLILEIMDSFILSFDPVTLAGERGLGRLEDCPQASGLVHECLVVRQGTRAGLALEVMHEFWPRHSDSVADFLHVQVHALLFTSADCMRNVFVATPAVVLVEHGHAVWPSSHSPLFQVWNSGGAVCIIYQLHQIH
jgi:hypothetical protein